MEKAKLYGYLKKTGFYLPIILLLCSSCLSMPVSGYYQSYAVVTTEVMQDTLLYPGHPHLRLWVNVHTDKSEGFTFLLQNNGMYTLTEYKVPKRNIKRLIDKK